MYFTPVNFTAHKLFQGFVNTCAPRERIRGKRAGCWRVIRWLGNRPASDLLDPMVMRLDIRLHRINPQLTQAIDGAAEQ